MDIIKPTKPRIKKNTRGFRKGFGDGKSKTRHSQKRRGGGGGGDPDKLRKKKISVVSLFMLWELEAPKLLVDAFWKRFREPNDVPAKDFVLWLVGLVGRHPQGRLWCQWFILMMWGWQGSINGKKPTEYQLRNWLLKRCED